MYDHWDPIGTQRKPTHCESYTSITSDGLPVKQMAAKGSRLAGNSRRSVA